MKYYVYEMSYFYDFVLYEMSIYYFAIYEMSIFDFVIYEISSYHIYIVT